MSTIRKDLVGSVTLHHKGRVLSLHAGDEVPDGARVRADLLADEPETKDTKADEPDEGEKDAAQKRDTAE